MRPATEVLLNVGDLEQLLPYSNLNEKEQRTFEGSARRHKIAWSLMHQFVHSERKRTGQPNFPGLTMTAEFRSHPRITELLSPFYPYELRDRPLLREARHGSTLILRRIPTVTLLTTPE
jgi:hypothetical protein